MTQKLVRKVGCQPPMRGHCCKVLLARPPTRLEAQRREVSPHPPPPPETYCPLLRRSRMGLRGLSERPPPTSGGNHRQTKSGQPESNRYRSNGYNKFAFSLSNSSFYFYFFFRI